jgi:hypothetical protein
MIDENNELDDLVSYEFLKVSVGTKNKGKKEGNETEDNNDLMAAVPVSRLPPTPKNMTDTLQMTATENGIAILMLFIFGIVGAAIGKISVKFVNPIASNQICQILTGLNTGMAALILYGPGQQIRAYIVASIWGLGAGWKNTIERFTITQIIPKGQDAELMGFYLFASQILVWCPTLLFTILNEVGVNPRLSLLVLIVFFAGGFVSLWMVGPYEEAVRVAREHNNDVRADINDEQSDDGSFIATPSQQTDDKIEGKN